jgi:hypothetical protein
MNELNDVLGAPDKHASCRWHRGPGFHRLSRQRARERRKRIVVEYYANWYVPRVGWYEDGHMMYPKNSNRQKYLKRQTNKRVRQSRLRGKGNAYRRMLDYQWELD